MELYQNLRIIRKNLWLVVFTTLVAAASALGYDHLRHARTTYIATASMVINPNVPHRGILRADPQFLQSQGNRIDTATLASTYDSYLTSVGFAQQVVQTYHLPISAADLAAGATTQLTPNTLVMQISVTSYNKNVVVPAALDLIRLFVRQDANAAANTTASQLPVSVVPGLADALQSYWSARITGLGNQLSAVVRDPSLNPIAKSQRVVALQNALSDALNNRQSGVAAAYGNAQPQGQTQNNLYYSALNAAAYSNGYVTGPNVLVRSLVIANIVLIAAVAGLIVGLALALLREYLDASLRDAEEVTQLLALPVLATVGFFGGVLRRRGPRLPRGVSAARLSGRRNVPTPRQAREALVTVAKPFHAASEVFRSLRTGILFAGTTHRVRTLVVTSALPGEGKSVVAANLAVVMAEAGERVILVDADMRRPVQHALFGLSVSDGLSSLYLAGDDHVAVTALHSLRQTAVPNLRLLDAGRVPPNPAELLASARTTAIVRALAGQADVVIFDTPAMGLLTDGVIMASHADATLFVVRARYTRRDLVKKAATKLTTVNARVVGVVLNMGDESGMGYARYYQRGRHAAGAATLAAGAGDGRE